MALIYLLIVLLNKQTKSQYRLASIDDLLEGCSFLVPFNKSNWDKRRTSSGAKSIFNRMIQRF